MELTKNKLNKILKKYRTKLEQHEKEWTDLCRKKITRKIEGDKLIITTPSIYDHEAYNSKGAQLFRDIMKEFEGYEVFPKKTVNKK